jgi:hypothetical protein
MCSSRDLNHEFSAFRADALPLYQKRQHYQNDSNAYDVFLIIYFDFNK